METKNSSVVGRKKTAFRKNEGPKRKLTERQIAAKKRLAAMTPEQRRTHDPSKAPNPKMVRRHPGEVRITSLIVDELTTALKKILPLDGPADVLMSIYFKNARKLGPRERSIVAEAIYFTLRHLSMITWRMAPVSPVKAPRLTALLALALQHGKDKLEDKIIGREMQPLTNMLKAADKKAPKFVQAELPEWLFEKLAMQYSDHKVLFDALLQGAPLDLRVNTLKAKPEEVKEELANHGVRCEEGKYSPECLRLSDKPGLTQWPVYKEGKVEVQDEGSQLIARLLQPKRGEMICDFCAGAGGKTLAVGALMKSTGRLYAFDVNEKRLDGMTPRLRRAGLTNVHSAVIRNEHDQKIKRLYGKMDRVLVDAPCSGTGTYRRNPDLKWRFGEDELERLNEVQKSVIRSAAKMLKPGGRLVYATCSLLKQENQDVIEDFIAENPDFELLNAWEVLDKQGVEVPEFQKERFKEYFVMLPHLNETDGFFGAVLQKKKEEKPGKKAKEKELLPAADAKELLPEAGEDKELLPAVEGKEELPALKEKEELPVAEEKAPEPEKAKAE